MKEFFTSRVRDKKLLIVDSENPGNADETAFDAHFDAITIVETIEVLARDGDALKTPAVAPRVHDELVHGKKTRHGETTDHARLVVLRRRMIQRTVDEKQRAEQPGNGHKSMKNALEQLDFLMAQGEALDPHSQSNRREKNNADEDEDTVQFQRRIKDTGNEKCNRAKQENAQAIDKIAANRTPRFDGVHTAMFADVSRAVCPAVRTTDHGWESFQIR